jgi:hypothetical protein
MNCIYRLVWKLGIGIELLDHRIVPFRDLAELDLGKGRCL